MNLTEVENIEISGEVNEEDGVEVIKKLQYALEVVKLQASFWKKTAESRQKVVVIEGEKTLIEKLLVPIFGEGASRSIVAFYLGVLFGLGFGLYIYSSRFFDLGLYMMLVGFFHMWEYAYVSIFRPTELRIEHYMIDHSIPFIIAYIASYVEYFFEVLFFPEIKGYRIIVYFGLVICIIGQIIRTVSMFQCGKNFNHIIETGEKRDDHELVTFGLYHVFRHPSYFGWFYWSVFTQVVLMNPITTITFSYFSWRFFSRRIVDEERELTNQFGDEYKEYQKKVGIHMPFIRGFVELRN